MNAKELSCKIRESERIAEFGCKYDLADVFEHIAKDVEQLIPRYRPPQPSDDGRWCFLEELPSDAPPTLVQSYRPMKYCDESRAYEPDFESTRWRFWTVAGWRELTKGVWPCERPEVAGEGSGEVSDSTKKRHRGEFWFISSGRSGPCGRDYSNGYTVHISGDAPITAISLTDAKRIAKEHGASGKWVRSEVLNGRKMERRYHDARKMKGDA